jgi:hypothetical protein
MLPRFSSAVFIGVESPATGSTERLPLDYYQSSLGAFRLEANPDVDMHADRN